VPGYYERGLIMDNQNIKTRREFLSDIFKTGSVAAVGGLVSIGLSPQVSSAKDPAEIIALTEITPGMILYKEINKPVSTGFKESRFVTVDSKGVIYLAGDQAVRIIDAQGILKEIVDLTVSPFCLVPAADRFFIGTKDRIVITDKKGKVQKEWASLGGNAWITSLAISENYIFIADAGQRIVWCYDIDGNFIRKIGEKNLEKNISGFVVPGPYFDLAMAPDGLLRVVNPGNHQIEAYTITGDREFAWGKFGNRLEDFTACCNPVSIAVLSDSSIITCEKGVARVKVYDTFGKLKGFVADPKKLENVPVSTGSKQEQSQLYGFDIAADDTGYVYILDRARNTVRFYRHKDS
jgi:hypothetical protein